MFRGRDQRKHLLRLLPILHQSAAAQVAGSKDKSFNPAANGDPIHNLRDVRHGDMAIKEMIRLDQDTDAARALIEATRRAHARRGRRQPAGRELFLEREADLFRTSGRARPLRMIFRPVINTDEKVALALRHATGSQPEFWWSMTRALADFW